MIELQPLLPEFARRFETLKITNLGMASAAVSALMRNRGRYEALRDLQASQGLVPVPFLFIGPVNYRESGGRLDRYLGNGDPLNQVSIHVPRGRGPFSSWEAGAADALHLDQVDSVTSWSLPMILARQEAYNGEGYRARSLVTPYVFADTDQYSSGKYGSDGHFDPNLVDQQVGTAALIKIMLDQDPHLADELQDVELKTPPQIHPEPVRPVPLGLGGDHPVWNAFAIQVALNRLRVVDPPLRVDGSYGRITRLAVQAFQARYMGADGRPLQVDGVAGPETLAALDHAMAGLPAV